MPRSLAKRWGYAAIHVFARLMGTTLFRIRVFGREHEPLTGGALVCANHQSFFDPVLVGLALERRLNYLARDTLFKTPGFKQIIEYFDAIPIDREGKGIAGLKETLRRLKDDEFVLIFPEGTRTRDGEVQRFKSGFCAVARRAKQPLLPVGIDGAYQAWPREQKLPGIAVIRIVVGPAITPEEAATMTDVQLTAELQRRVEACHAAARASRLH